MWIFDNIFYVNSVHPDQTAPGEQSDLSLQCLIDYLNTETLEGYSRIQRYSMKYFKGYGMHVLVKKMEGPFLGYRGKRNPRF